VRYQIFYITLHYENRGAEGVGCPAPLALREASEKGDASLQNFFYLEMAQAYFGTILIDNAY